MFTPSAGPGAAALTMWSCPVHASTALWRSAGFSSLTPVCCTGNSDNCRNKWSWMKCQTCPCDMVLARPEWHIFIGTLCSDNGSLTSMMLVVSLFQPNSAWRHWRSPSTSTSHSAAPCHCFAFQHHLRWSMPVQSYPSLWCVSWNKTRPLVTCTGSTRSGQSVVRFVNSSCDGSQFLTTSYHPHHRLPPPAGSSLAS